MANNPYDDAMSHVVKHIEYKDFEDYDAPDLLVGEQSDAGGIVDDTEEDARERMAFIERLEAYTGQKVDYSEIRNSDPEYLGWFELLIPELRNKYWRWALSIVACSRDRARELKRPYIAMNIDDALAVIAYCMGDRDNIEMFLWGHENQIAADEIKALAREAVENV